MTNWRTAVSLTLALGAALPAAAYANEQSDIDARIAALERQNGELRKRLKLQALEKENAELERQLGTSSVRESRAATSPRDARAEVPRGSIQVERAYAKAPIVPVQAQQPPLNRWAGPYAGLHAGGGVGRWKTSTTAVSSSFGSTTTSQGAAAFDPVGAMAGVHAGYTWQAGSFVFGPEIDFSASTIAEREVVRVQQITTGPFGGTGQFISGLSVANRWLGSARLLAGVALEDWLFYGTAGGAVGGFDMTAILSDLQQTKRALGYVAGGGVQRAIGPVSLKAEYLYYNFGRLNFADASQGFGITTTYAASLRPTDTHVVRFGMDWRFGPWMN